MPAMDWRGGGAPAGSGFVLLVGCARSDVCGNKVAAGDFAGGADACARAMAAGDERAAIPRAKALLQLRRGDELIALAQEVGARRWASPVLLAAGKAHLQAGRFESARDTLMEALARARADANAAEEARAAFWLHRMYHERTGYRASLAYARQAHVAALRTGDDDMVGTALMAIFQG